MNQDHFKTIDAVKHHGWRIVLLGPRAKKPHTPQWIITSDPEVIKCHNGNIGLVTGQSHVAVLDFDNLDAMRVLYNDLGELTPWVETGSGKFHVYVRLIPELPSKMLHNGVVIGEVQRGAMQQVVMPPSIHPVTGLNYRWLVDPRDPVPELPRAWLDYLLRDQNTSMVNVADDDSCRPSYIKAGDQRGVPPKDPWNGPPPEEMLRRAWGQPGAKQRAKGIKFQCAGCVAEGHDKSRDNAIVYLDGKFGCAFSSLHKPDIARQLGVPIGWPTVEISLEGTIKPDIPAHDDWPIVDEQDYDDRWPVRDDVFIPAKGKRKSSSTSGEPEL